LERV